jgi:hypothetical protein
MTLHTPPSWLQNASHPAENDRLTTQAIFNTTGIVASPSLKVTANSPAAMNVYVADGWAAIVGTTQADMGTYMAYNDASVLLTITTSNPTNPRIDLVCLTINDSYYSGSTNNVVFQVIAGTPAGSPVAPSLPANSISLATISVGAGVTSINSGNITDTRVLATTNLSPVGINAQTGTTYTTVYSDINTLVTLNNGSSIAVTIPLNSSVAYPIGTQLNFARYGAGSVTISGSAGVTIVSTGATAATPTLRATYSTATAVQTSTNNWLIMGDIA